MTPKGLQRLLVILLALASLGTTALVLLSIVSRRQAQNPTPSYAVPAAGESAPSPSTASPLPSADAAPPPLFSLPQFTLTQQNGHPFPSTRLRGKTSIVDFVFTRCAGPCPMLTSRMAQLQAQIDQHPGRDRIRLVTITVDPDYDTPAVLSEYAALAHADPDRWFFLTGTRDAAWRLVKDGFRLPVFEDSPEAGPGAPIVHSQKFVLVDYAGQVRGYYDALEPQGSEDLLRDLDLVLAETWDLSFLPAVNASINACAAVALVLGLIFIKRGRAHAHRNCMLSAAALSALFLVLYVTHYVWRYTHLGGTHTQYHGPEPVKTLYYGLLLSHIPLAATVPAFAIRLIQLALKHQFDRHRRLAKVAYPVWMYTSLSGVVIYFMLYWFNHAPT